MKVIFERTKERGYAIHAVRPGMLTVTLDPAPGFDELVPHDLMHMVVEGQLGLNGGVFGQLAAGGLAGTFHLAPDRKLGKKEASRLRKSAAAVDKKLLEQGRGDAEESERATYICWHEWLSRSPDRARSEKAGQMAENARHVRGTASDVELAKLDKNVIDQICLNLDILSECWSGLAVGGKMTVLWPEIALL